MATPNYGYEKRQRELAKKKKKEDKLREKTLRKNETGHDADQPASADGEAGTSGPAPESGTPA